jgi:hypothetical protein
MPEWLKMKAKLRKEITGTEENYRWLQGKQSKR